jgi:L-2-hydroxyglutarate oxidase LhgO
MDSVECVVIGAGVVGLACARALALQGREVIILEQHAQFGTETSARNSEVIHAGIYYSSGSLKAQLCLLGRDALYAYCAERGIAHRRCGKLLVATNAAQLDKLDGLYRQGVANGVTDLERLTAAEATALEPQLRCVAAVNSPSTGIIDSHALMLSLLGDAERAGAVLAVNSPVLCASIESGGTVVEVGVEGTTLLSTKLVVNAAGLGAPSLAAKFSGLSGEHVPTPFFAKGNYYALAGRAPFSRLVYPMPEVGGTGVHITLDLAGQARFGPDVQWLDAPDYSVDPARARHFYDEIRRYWPELPDNSLLPAYAGVRPKISGPKDVAADFLIQGQQAHGIKGLVNLFGIESPGLTASLAIGDYVARLLD